MSTTKEQSYLIITCDSRGIILSANDSAADLLHTGDQSLISQSLDDYVTLNSGQTMEAYLAMVAEAMSHGAQGKSILCTLEALSAQVDLSVWGLQSDHSTEADEPTFLCHFNLVSTDSKAADLSTSRSVVDLLVNCSKATLRTEVLITFLVVPWKFC